MTFVAIMGLHSYEKCIQTRNIILYKHDTFSGDKIVLPPILLCNIVNMRIKMIHIIHPHRQNGIEQLCKTIGYVRQRLYEHELYVTQIT